MKKQKTLLPTATQLLHSAKHWCVSLCREVGNLGGIDPLVSILGDMREEAVANAACTLTNLAQDEGLRSEAKNRSVVPALIEPLRSS